MGERIEAAGHAETPTTPRRNRGLSQRRARATASGPVHPGVSREAITARDFDETRPLVPTGDGVREARNRRVEIAPRRAARPPTAHTGRPSTVGDGLFRRGLSRAHVRPGGW